jgi:hypothetical protein
MMDFLNFVFIDFGHFIGVAILLTIIVERIASIFKSLFRKIRVTNVVNQNDKVEK